MFDKQPIMYPLAVGAYRNLQLLNQPWVWASGTHYSWVT